MADMVHVFPPLYPGRGNREASGVGEALSLDAKPATTRRTV